ncbi:hypothetical protein EZ449_21640 [Pedobacter frigidisoli]|uniref:Uncharacterized protein n=1 Tax=Pedobacter frigidisoli TaxID=2530455 RepID=A0A4R0NCY8_9SPHI|nr:hypothetical protein [Pedobacter frigidisoli]TCC98125.1 hypothetical protein EZ449_21640 [Pedobacter frigidisoli]
MTLFIIILRTTVQNSGELEIVSKVMFEFAEISKWSIDLEDCDRILRVEATARIGDQLKEKLNELGLDSAVLETFDSLLMQN